MVAVSVAEDSSRYDAMDAVTNISSIGGGAGAATETDIAWQNGIAISRKVTAGGFYSSTGANRNMTTAGRSTWIVKEWLTNYGSLSTGGNSMEARLGSGTGAYYTYILGDPNTEYKPIGGWVIQAIDPNVTAHRDATTGSPALTACNYFAAFATCSTSKENNLVMDAIDVGYGLYLTGGTSTDADGVFQNFVDDDEGSASAGRFGYVTTAGGVLFVYGKLVIGATSSSGTPTAAATEFTDSGVVIIFPNHLAAAGFSGLDLNLGNAGTTISLNGVDVTSQGRSNLKRYFDTEGQVDGTNEELDITAHGFFTGDAVLYTNEGGTESIGLTNNTEYWVEVVTTNSISLHTSRQNAITAATPVGLTASTAGNGEEHSLRRQPDTRADILVTGTSGVLTADSCKWARIRQVDLTSAATLTSCALSGGTGLTLNQGTVTNCTFSAHVNAFGESYISTPDLTDIVDCSFTAGEAGHAIVRTGTAATEALDGCSFTGYGNDPDPGRGMEFHTTNDIDDGNDEIDYTAHGWTTGDAVYYNDNGGAQAIGLTDGGRYYVRAVTANSISLHPSQWAAENNANKIALTAGGTETHTFYSANAAIVNNTGGAMTINITGGGNTPSIRNVGTSTTTVNNAVTLTITVLDEAGSPVNLAQTAIYTVPGGTSLMNADTNASGVATVSYNYVADQAISIRVRKNSPGDTRYVPNTSTGTITTSGYTATVTLVEDTIAA